MEEGQVYIEYVVKFKSNGVIPSPPRLQQKVQKGIQGRFQAEEGEEEGAIEDARKAVEDCKKFFNYTETVQTRVNSIGFLEEMFSETEFGADGKPKSLRKTEFKEIVAVWVERYRCEKNKRPVMIDTTEPKTPVKEATPAENMAAELERLRAENEKLKMELELAALTEEDELEVATKQD